MPNKEPSVFEEKKRFVLWLLFVWQQIANSVCVCSKRKREPNRDSVVECAAMNTRNFMKMWCMLSRAVWARENRRGITHFWAGACTINDIVKYWEWKMIEQRFFGSSGGSDGNASGGGSGRSSAAVSVSRHRLYNTWNGVSSLISHLVTCHRMSACKQMYFMLLKFSISIYINLCFIIPVCSKVS